MTVAALVDQATFWRREIALCSRDRMYGCAATAYSEYLRHAPEADTPEARAEIASLRARGDEALKDTWAERAARAVEEGRARKERRAFALHRRASTKGLTEAETAELHALAAELDAT